VAIMTETRRSRSTRRWLFAVVMSSLVVPAAMLASAFPALAVEVSSPITGGEHIQVPVEVPIQVCGNDIDIVAVVVHDLLAAPQRGCDIGDIG
jgi:hypothetical protein